MDADKESEDDAHSLTSHELLHLAETHLRLRNYSLSSQYALESLQSTAEATASYEDGIRLRAQRIVAISDVLAAGSETLGSSFSNWYSVLGVDTFCSDINLIRSRFKSLLLLLAPVRSTFPPAEAAMRSAWKAWTVLGSPEKKSELDAQLYAALAGGGSEGSESFWTVCPYCYFMYEYDRVLEGYCLRCQNASCRRVFQGMSTRSQPSVGLNQDGKFSCFGYFPLGFSNLESAGYGKNCDSWSPFVAMFGLPEERTIAKRKGLDGNTGFVEISDDTEDPQAPMHKRDEQTGCGIPGNENIEGSGGGLNVSTRLNLMDCNTASVNGKMLMQRGRIFHMSRSANLSDAMGNGGVDERNFDQHEEDCGFVAEGSTTAGYGFHREADMQFVEKDGEIFLEVPSGTEY